MKHFLTLIAFLLTVPALAQSPAAVEKEEQKPDAAASYEAPSAHDRLEWYARSSFGWQNWAAGTFTSAFWTALNRPEEWGDTWEGFAKRFGSRQACVMFGNGVEAGLGAIWGEDPRYWRQGGGKFWSRTGHAFRTTFLAYNREGRLMPAYARYAGVVSSGFLANAWFPDSANRWQDGLARAGWGILGRFSSNLFAEFWPDVWRKIRGK